MFKNTRDRGSKPQGAPRRHVSRRQFLAAAGASAAGALLTGGCPECACPHPNILFLMVDQMRWPRWFPATATLPAFERLRSEGLTFSNFFTSAVPCSASRATLLTGLHQDQHGIRTNVSMGLIPGDSSLNPRIPTMGHYFQDAGYRTPYFGKWHLTETSDTLGRGLCEYGFDCWHSPDAWGWPWQGLTRDPMTATQTLDWLKDHGQCCPWILTCSLVEPHGIMYYRNLAARSVRAEHLATELPGNFDDTLEGKPTIQQQYRDVYGAILGMAPDTPEEQWLKYLDYYYMLTEEADRQMTRVLDGLDCLGLAEDTLVVFFSDHGEMAGSHKLQSKGPYMYNENNNVPFVIRWPGRVSAGVETTALAQSVDVLPTLLDLANIDAPTDYLPGKSLTPVINDPGKAGVNDHILMSFGYSNQDDFTQLAGVGSIPELTAPMMLRGIFDGRYKFAKYFDLSTTDVEYEMYDLEADPLEMANVAATPEYAAQADTLRQNLEAALAAEAAPIPEEVYRPA